MTRSGLKVIHIARSEAQAREIADLLEQEGFYVKVMKAYRQQSAEDNCYEIAVAGSEASDAQQAIIEHNLLY